MICENCGCEHDGKYGSGRFCSSICARSYSSKKCNNNRIKSGICKNCGNKIYTNIHSNLNNIYCSQCKSKLHNHKCKICGNDNCDNLYCKSHNMRSLKSLIKFGLDKNKIGTNEIFKEIEKVKNKLLNLYILSELSTVEIANLYNCKVHYVTDAFKSLDISLRNSSDALFIAIKNNKINLPNTHSFYKDEWHQTWDGNKVYLRSSYETDFANSLDLQQIHYEVESLKIQYYDSQLQRFRIAIPDFYIPSTNTIYEIKSTYTYDEINMFDKFNEYKKLGYKCILILDHQEILIE